MRWQLLSYTRFLWSLALAYFASAAGFPGPVALVTEAGGGAEVQRSGLSTPIPSYTGDLVFPGDVLIASTAPVALAFCPDQHSYRLSSGRATVLADSVLVDGKTASGVPMAIPCELPAITYRTYRGAGLAADRLQAETESAPSSSGSAFPPPNSSIAALNRYLQNRPGDIAAQISRAIEWEQQGNLAAAASDWKTIASAAPNALWAADQMRSILAAIKRAAAGGGKTIAVLVGISRYRYFPASAQLHYADRDAAAFYEYLTSQRGGARPNDIVLLLNEQADIATIRAAVNQAFASAGPKDNVVLYFAAHGGPIESGPNSGAYIAAWDSHLGEPSSMYGMSDLQKATDDRLRPSQVQIIADVCHAAYIGGSQAGVENLFLTDFVNERRSHTQVLGLLASGKKQDSYECANLTDSDGQGGHGAFTYFLLRGLGSDTEALAPHIDGITVLSLFEYVREGVKHVTWGMPNPQIPVRDGDFDDSQVLADTKLSAPKIAAAPAPLMCLPPSESLGRSLPSEVRGGLLDSVTLQATAEMRAGQEVIARYLMGEQGGMSHDDFATCEVHFSRAAQLQAVSDPLTQARLLFCTGRKLVYENNLNEAIRVLEQSIRRDPLGAYTYNALGIALLQRPDFKSAIAAFRDAVRLAPTWAYARHNLALALSEDGQYTPAIAAYREAMQLGKQYAYIPLNLGLLYEHLDLPEQARAAFQAALSISAHMSRASTGIGVSYALEGRPRKAEAAYRTAISDATTKTDRLAARHDLALLLEKKKPSEAVTLWRANLAEDSEDVPTLIGLSHALYRSGDFAAAQPVFAALLENQREHPASRLEYAHLLAAERNSQEAMRQLRLVLQAEPRSEEAAELLGDLLPRTHDHARAEVQTLYTSALKNANTRKQRARLKKKIESLR